MKYKLWIAFFSLVLTNSYAQDLDAAYKLNLSDSVVETGMKYRFKRVFFDFNKPSIHYSSFAELYNVVLFLKDHPNLCISKCI